MDRVWHHALQDNSELPTDRVLNANPNAQHALRTMYAKLVLLDSC